MLIILDKRKKAKKIQALSNNVSNSVSTLPNYQVHYKGHFYSTPLSDMEIYLVQMKLSE